MHEMGKTNTPEHESDREFDLAITVLDRVRRLIDDNSESMHTDLLSAEQGVKISDDPEMDADVHSTARYYMSNRFKLAAASIPEGQPPITLDNADFSVLTRRDEIEESVTFFTYTNVYTSDGAHSRCTTVVWMDEFIQKSHMVSIDGSGRLLTKGKVDPRTDGPLREVFRAADQDEGMMIGAILAGTLKKENLEYALGCIRELAEKTCMPYEVEELMQELQKRHDNAKSASEFYGAVSQADKLSEYDLADLLTYIDGFN